MSPKMFNVYLEEALFSNPLLKEAIMSGKLLAFADDLLVMADSVAETEELIRALESLN